MRKPQCKWDSVHSGPQNPQQHSFTERFGSKWPNGLLLRLQAVHTAAQQLPIYLPYDPHLFAKNFH